MLKGKIEELRGLMEEKQQALRQTPPGHAFSYCFKEIKLGDIEEIRAKSANTLHSHRQCRESPVTRNFKAKKLLHHSNNLTPEHQRKAETSEGRRKMQLVGGGITSKWQERRDAKTGSPAKLRRQMV